MIQQVYSIFDEKAKIFNNPFLRLNDGIAHRDFGDLTKDQSTSIAKHPEDYKLYRVASYDDSTGRFESLKMPDYICKATDFKMDK